MRTDMLLYNIQSDPSNLHIASQNRTILYEVEALFQILRSATESTDKNIRFRTKWYAFLTLFAQNQPFCTKSKVLPEQESPNRGILSEIEGFSTV